MEFQRKIELICEERGPDDEWGNRVKAKLALVSDLHAADAVYHKACCVNFRTNKQLPKCFQDNPEYKRTPGRTEDNNQASAFIKVAEYLEENDIQVTLSELVEKMKEFCPNPYSSVYMKKKLLEYFGDSIVITELNGTPNVVTLTKSVWSILQQFYKRLQKDTETEKRAIIDTAAKLIKSDIKLLEATKSRYPSSSDVASLQNNLQFVPESLQLLLKGIISEKENDLKVCSIGQALIQAARPRVLLAPLRIGLGIQMHHHFGSRFLIDTLNKMGFCSSYLKFKGLKPARQHAREFTCLKLEMDGLCNTLLTTLIIILEHLMVMVLSMEWVSLLALLRESPKRAPYTGYR